jgi:hypothetical protein
MRIPEILDLLGRCAAALEDSAKYHSTKESEDVLCEVQAVLASDWAKNYAVRLAALEALAGLSEGIGMYDDQPYGP